MDEFNKVPHEDKLFWLKVVRTVLMFITALIAIFKGEDVGQQIAVALQHRPTAVISPASPYHAPQTMQANPGTHSLPPANRPK